MTKVGFTGNQHGMTEAQKQWLREAFAKMPMSGWEFHHGDCIGSDAEAHDIAYEHGATICIHPPEYDGKRAHKKGFACAFPKPYLDRNKDIVNATEVLIGMPKEEEEQLRSGTWSTIRYAKKTGKPIRVIGPLGNRIL